MKHYWLIIKAKDPKKIIDIKREVKQKVLENLSIYPDFVGVNSIDESTLVLSFSANNASFGYLEPYSFTDDSLLMVEGLPTLERFGISPTENIPSALQKILQFNRPQELYQKLGGVWSIGYADKNVISAFCDFTGYLSCYFHQGSDYVVVGNSARLVAQFRMDPQAEKTNWKALSWIASTTMIWGNETAFDGVYKVSPGSVLEIKGNSIEPTIKGFSTNYHTPLYLPSERDKQNYIKETVERMCNKVSWYLKRGIKVHSHLTGGKDTRMILALLMGSGAINNIEKLSTTGDEANGDVIVARLISKALGLEKLHTVKEGNKSRAAAGPDRLANRFAYCANRFEGHLTPYDGGENVIAKLPGMCSIMGGGGEIYRSKLNINAADPDKNFNTLLNAYCSHNKMDFLTPQALDMQHRFVKEVVQHNQNNNITNQEMKFYIDQRLSNWGPGAFSS